MHQIKPMVSIITVVFNSEAFLEKTILSVINQSYTDFEYIVVDGGSTDGTLQIIEKYNTYISAWISEKDKGLYDAMNKGMDMAKGNYLWFINSGDEIYSETVLSEIFSNQNTMHDLIYGETEIIDYKGNIVGMRRHSAPKKLSYKSFRYGMKVCHQSAIVNSAIAGKYNLNYKFSSDFDWMLEVLKKAQSIYNSGIILSKFMEGGQTTKNLIPGLKERFAIMSKNYGFVPTLLRHFWLVARMIWFYAYNRRI